MLKGNKVILRPVRKSDVQHLLKWLGDSEVTKYLLTYMPVTEIVAEKIVEGDLSDEKKASFAIDVIEDDNGKTIGMITLGDIHPKDHKASFAIAIGETEYWGKGYGSEAARLLINYGFEQLNLHRIDTEVFASNERSLRMCRSIGFKEEGRKREAIFKNGEFGDVVVFGILREEWKAPK